MPARAFVSVPDTAWVGRGTAFGPPTAQRRCTLLVVWYAEQEEPWIILTDLPPEDAGPSWYALRFWVELGFKAIKSLGWKWDKLGAPTQPASPATGWCCRWPHCWPWPTAPGWKTPRTGGSPQAACGHRPKAGSQSPGPSKPSGAHRQRNPPRHRLAQAVAAQGSPLEPRLAAARTLAPTQAQPRSPIMRPRNSPYLPLSALDGGRLGWG